MVEYGHKYPKMGYFMKPLEIGVLTISDHIPSRSKSTPKWGILGPLEPTLTTHTDTQGHMYPTIGHIPLRTKGYIVHVEYIVPGVH